MREDAPMNITRAVVAREVLFIVALVAAVIAVETFLNFLVTSRANLGLFAAYVIIRVLFFAANARRGVDEAST